jgi:CRISPR-associated protein Cas5h
MYGLTIDLECPYFGCFRHPTSTSLILSYPVPPYTTIRGLLANALGLARNDFYLQDKLAIGMRPLRWERATRELCKILKLKEFEKARITSFPSSPMFRYFLVKPAYRIYLGGEKELLRELKEALENPARLLYLGQSDDVVDVEVFPVTEIKRGVSKEVYSIFPGIKEGCETLKLPYKFQDVDTLIYSPVLSLPKSFPCNLKREIEIYFFDSQAIWLLGKEEFDALSKEGGKG